MNNIKKFNEYILEKKKDEKTIDSALEKIINRYKSIETDGSNYAIGGGLSRGKFASRRHEDAKDDESKMTLGKATQLFKRATGLETNDIKEIIKYALPNMEWHHAGKLPKEYGGGMKKTYFLNSSEIVHVAENWHSLVEKLNKFKLEEEKKEKEKESKEEKRERFLKKHATYVERVEEVPEFFHETNYEMNGKYGWFSAYGKSYNLPKYYSGWKFNSKEDFKKFINL